MKQTMRLLVAVFLSAFLTACQIETQEKKGAVIGAVAGTVIGSQFGGGTGRVLAAVTGAGLGAFAGSKIGASMDKLDRLELEKALEETPNHKTYRWKNHEQKASYRVQPTKTYYRKLSNGRRQPCRQFIMTTLMNGKPKEVMGRACRHADGVWKIERS